MNNLAQRVAVVTGAASGIGLAVSEVLAREGMCVAMADLNEERLREQAERLRLEGHAVIAVPTDVRDPQAVEELAEAVVTRYGALNVAVNNAGIVNRGVTWEMPLEEWHRVLDVNLWGVIHGVHAFVPRILATGGEGHVVNVASMAAVSAVGQLGPYTAAKHAVLGLSDVLRKDLEAAGAPVGVSVVMPGMIRTGMNPIGTVEPVAVATNVVNAIRLNRAYVYTDDHHRSAVEERLRALIDARDEVIR